MRKIIFLQILVLCLLVISCKKESDNNSDLSLAKVSGYVQKGPYLNGTNITISELSAQLVPTGKLFTSQIIDNKGTFEITNVELASHYVELKADGFYFNEVTNINSTSQLTLFALSDLSDKTSLNVNILSTLEKNRVNYLISNGKDLTAAKKQAQSEILAIFNLQKSDIPVSEKLDITQSGEDNAILLAISVIVQGYLPVADLSEFLANISTDIREDGILNSQALGSKLINNAKTIKLPVIRDNLVSRYNSLGIDVTIPDFEKQVNQFIDNTDFVFTGYINYPTTGQYGLNILDKEKIEYAAGSYSMKAILPEGTSLQVKVAGSEWSFPAYQDNTGWSHSELDYSDHSRIFTATQTGEIDFQITLGANTTISAFENGAATPTWTKTIIIK